MIRLCALAILAHLCGCAEPESLRANWGKSCEKTADCEDEALFCAEFYGGERMCTWQCFGSQQGCPSVPESDVGEYRCVDTRDFGSKVCHPEWVD